MTDAEVTALEAHKLSNLIIEEWLASFSDSGFVWDKARAEVIKETKKLSPEVIVEAQAIARKRWEKLIHNDKS